MGVTNKRRRSLGQCLTCEVATAGTAYCTRCAAEANERNKNRFAERVANGLCRLCGKTLDCDLTCCRKCARKLSVQGKKKRQELKQEVFAAYGGVVCKGCGENRIACLTIDHIKGGGTQHRKAIKTAGGYDFYGWLKKHGYPSGFQVLCMNCQWIKRADDENNGKHLGRVEIEEAVDEIESKISQGILWEESSE